MSACTNVTKTPFRSRALTLIFSACCAAMIAPAHAHDGKHGPNPQTIETPLTSKSAGPPPLPFPAKIGGRFNLIDQNGAKRTLADFAGKPVLIFFGYANCKSICSVALPRMAETVDRLKDTQIDVQPILITVDPENDTPAYMRAKLPKIHASLVGLTGSPSALSSARKAFHVDAKHVSDDKDGGKIYSHGSFIYLMSKNGKFLTLMPPVLGSERMAEIVRSYL